MAQRIQRKRTKGWRMPPNTVAVSRGTRWGNPYKVILDGGDWWVTRPDTTLCLGPMNSRASANFDAVQRFRSIIDRETIADIKRELRGKDLACWCPLDMPCHADVLLELANG